MTMLNGEPIETPDISTAPSAPGTATAPVRQDQTSNVLGLMSLIFAIVFPLAGAILGGIAMSQAKKAGANNTLAKAGFWVGLVLTVLIVAVTVVVIVLGVNVFGGLFGELFRVCSELGDGTHVVDGVTYRCNVA
ncbi:MAG: hypothetical protein JWP85_1348 [Rhodoglobus sp.]|nr:hypothetical protein [Rhodoglobus sp.]